jgi:hypothetical protein
MGIKSQYEDVWDDAVAAEAAVLRQRQVERGYRRVLAMTDGVLAELERRNLRGQPELDAVVKRQLARTLAEVPPDARRRFPNAGSVQEALDGIFLVQESILLVLQRLLHWDRLVA